MSDDDLDALFKTANVISYAAALRAIYDAGRTSVAAPTPAPLPEFRVAIETNTSP